MRVLAIAAALLSAGSAAAQSADPFTSEPTNDVGKWVEQIEYSPIDFTPSVLLSLESDDQIAGPSGELGPFWLHLRCMEDTTAAFIYFNEHVMSAHKGGGRVEYRLDDQDAQSVNMEVSSDHTALGLWSGSQAIAWIEELIAADLLVLRATPMNDITYTARFDLRGLDLAIYDLRFECGW